MKYLLELQLLTVEFWIILAGAIWFILWVIVFFRKKKSEEDFKSGSIERRNKLLDLQLKRIGVIILMVVFANIVYGINEYRKNNTGYYLSELSVPEKLASSGYNTITLSLQLQEIYEAGQDLHFEQMTHMRRSFVAIRSRDSEKPLIHLEVQGITFPLKNISDVLGELVFGNNKKSVTVGLLNDKEKCRSIVSITGEPVQIFEEHFDNTYNEDIALKSVLQKAEHYILEVIDPLWMSTDYFYKGNIIQAVKLLKDRLTADEGKPDYRTLYRLCYFLAKHGDLEEERKYLAIGEKFFPDSVTMLNRIASNYLDEKKYAAAATYCRKALDKSPRSFYPNCILGTIEYKRNEFDSAIDYFKTALTSGETHDKNAELDFYTGLSYTYLKKGMVDSCNTYYLKSVKCDPKSFEYLNDLYNFIAFDTTQCNGEPTMHKRYAELAKQFPHCLPVNYAMAFISMRKHDFKKTDQYIMSCLNDFPDFLNGQLLLTDVYYQLNELNKGDSVVHNLLTRYSKHYEVLYQKGQIEQLRGNLNEAQAKYKQALKLYPFNWAIIQKLILLQFDQGNHSAVVDNIYAYLDYRASDPVFNYLLGIEFFNNQNFAKAKYHFIIALRNGINNYDQFNLICLKLAGNASYLLKLDQAAIDYYSDYYEESLRRNQYIEPEVIFALRQLYTKYRVPMENRVIR